MSTYDEPDSLVEIVLGEYPDLTSDDELLRSKTAVQFMTDFAFAAPLRLS